jgi:hypothetical protein
MLLKPNAHTRLVGPRSVFADSKEINMGPTDPYGFYGPIWVLYGAIFI